MKNLFILCLLTPFLIWQSNVNHCHLIFDNALWDISSPYEFDLQYTQDGMHNITIIPIGENPEPVSFQIYKSSRPNKKFDFEKYKIIYNPGDEEYFLLEQLFWKGKIRK